MMVIHEISYGSVEIRGPTMKHLSGLHLLFLAIIALPSHATQSLGKSLFWLTLLLDRCNGGAG